MSFALTTMEPSASSTWCAREGEGVAEEGEGGGLRVREYTNAAEAARRVGKAEESTVGEERVAQRGDSEVEGM